MTITDESAERGLSADDDRIPVDVPALLEEYVRAESAARAAARRALGLNETDLAALQLLIRWRRAGHPVQNRDLARELTISTASVTAMLDRLERHGRIQRAPHGSDRRALLITIAPEVESRVQEVFDAVAERRDAVVAELTPEAHEVVGRFLTSVTTAVQDRPDIEREYREVVREDRGNDIVSD
jgi:DNA-binding MarR family transcriptional regulator